MSKRRILNVLKRQILPGLKPGAFKNGSWIKSLISSKAGELKMAGEIQWGADQVSSMAKMGQTMFLRS